MKCNYTTIFIFTKIQKYHANKQVNLIIMYKVNKYCKFAYLDFVGIGEFRVYFALIWLLFLYLFIYQSKQIIHMALIHKGLPDDYSECKNSSKFGMGQKYLT